MAPIVNKNTDAKLQWHSVLRFFFYAHFSVSIGYWLKTLEWAELAMSRRKQYVSRILKRKIPLQLRIYEK